MKYKEELVALFTRAWIEMDYFDTDDDDNRSPSSRGRGLKLNALNHNNGLTLSPSSRGRGLKYLR
ncbi:hypothetical protein EUBSIR_01893 [[Eubacterium] siraeum DSM 15702]|uniref:Uncharacterized protein n=1 Tax=[Eubacterium] siraeum DSM 15702 TaxID=428128 RepID=B0MPU0_9FIRM|nr:hypothetical protein EUBSIR_01893 [[Eubacterium] siraeum DSM 15702]